jgi:hypothetical protein
MSVARGVFLKIKIANKQFDLLPGLALKFFLGSLLVVLAVGFLVDSFVLTSLEDAGKICSHGWRHDDQTIVKQMRSRNYATDKCPIWHSEGFRVNVKWTASAIFCGHFARMHIQKNVR